MSHGIDEMYDVYKEKKTKAIKEDFEGLIFSKLWVALTEGLEREE